VSRSLNEIGLLCKRAARGGGLDWGLAEDAARGARWSASLGLPGPAMLATRLERLDGRSLDALSPDVTTDVWRAASGSLCPLAAGAALADRAARLAAGGPITLRDPACPLLVLAFANDAAEQLGTPVRLAWDGIRLTVGGGRLRIDGARDRLDVDGTTSLTCSIVKCLPEPAVGAGFRGEVDDTVWERLTVFAARTLAPATEESRRRGAGGE